MNTKGRSGNSRGQAVRNQITEAQKIAGGNGSETDIAEAKIELEVGPAVHMRGCVHH
jgi:hypothetical protein